LKKEIKIIPLRGVGEQEEVTKISGKIILATIKKQNGVGKWKMKSS
jgi:hypothetical protein